MSNILTVILNQDDYSQEYIKRICNAIELLDGVELVTSKEIDDMNMYIATMRAKNKVIETVLNALKE